jgi:hypothetical protein
MILERLSTSWFNFAIARCKDLADSDVSFNGAFTLFNDRTKGSVEFAVVVRELVNTLSELSVLSKESGTPLNLVLTSESAFEVPDKAALTAVDRTESTSTLSPDDFSDEPKSFVSAMSSASLCAVSNMDRLIVANPSSSSPLRVTNLSEAVPTRS